MDETAIITLLLKHKFDLNNRPTYFTYSAHRGRIVLALQLQHDILFKPITINIFK